MTMGFSPAGVERALVAGLVLLAVASLQSRAAAQARGGVPAPNPPTAQSTAPRDFTGYWMSMVTEDWRWRMVVPIKGDFNSVPLNADGRKAASAWDPSLESKPEEQCKA